MSQTYFFLSDFQLLDLGWAPWKQSLRWRILCLVVYWGFQEKSVKQVREAGWGRGETKYPLASAEVQFQPDLQGLWRSDAPQSCLILRQWGWAFDPIPISLWLWAAPRMDCDLWAFPVKMASVGQEQLPREGCRYELLAAPSHRCWWMGA